MVLRYPAEGSQNVSPVGKGTTVMSGHVNNMPIYSCSNLGVIIELFPSQPTSYPI